VSISCPTGKRIYWKERLANRAITEAAKRGELPPMRHYQCPECGYWHLSRKDRSTA
jgi:ssDNA-binding Zn-finger/Zn-ribbon topoisomerase 1